MATVTTINASDQITDSRAVINTNFSNLNSDKIETSVLDTDGTLAANSDSKVATQKAVKTYVDTEIAASAATHATVTISASQITSMFASPVTVISAPGSGSIIQLDEVLMKFVYNSVQYTLGGALQLNWSGTSTSVLDSSSTMLSGADIQAAASKSIRGRVNDLGITSTTFENTGIVLTNAGEAFATGNSTIKIYLVYRTVTL